ncbi:uncharacterized protein RHIMIDRAFT_248312 [Rhizopus microsporus ATCC 52813]|uniref:Uncharacterized protein n=1 Tax=Rhizopus microsporus ATCC 52813 TaxID=1340429 RepID=A0A2G4T243_RHIZD|nr:uncharacterized protein RHIMIDRAFT_248312 [Rhizopus microsporus ATCC 52813]PHZ15089.1 hypothetical protein RHIMIDRAFT_248312 [Rhizopus microsporus ATCC 52813]
MADNFDVTDAFRMMRFSLKNYNWKVSLEDHLHLALASTSILFLSPNRYPDEVKPCFKHNDWIAVINFMHDMYDIKKVPMPLNTVTNMLAIIDNLWTKTINREQAETSFKPLSLSSYEHKFVKALSALIIKLPPVSIEDVNEFELCTRNREEMLNSFVLAIISTQNEIKDAVKTISAQVAEIKNEIKELRTTKEEYEERLFEMQQENAKLRAQLESILANTADSSRPRRTRHGELIQGLFLDKLYPDRSAQHSVIEGIKSKRQFFWGLLRKLMEDVHGSPVDNVIFDAARDHITIFRLPALIREVKYKHQIENAIEALEEIAVPFIPLRASVGSWGANLMLRYYWACNEKNRYFAAFSNEQDQTPQNNTVHGRDSCQTSSSASTLHEESDESDDCDISDVRHIDAASIFTSTIHHCKANDTNKRRSNNKVKKVSILPKEQSQANQIEV